MNIVFPMNSLFNSVEGLLSPNLITRTFGEQAYEHMADTLSNLKPGNVLTLDFNGINIMDSSFAGGSLVQLLTKLVDGQFGEKYIILKNANGNTEYNIDMTINGHGLKLAVESIACNASKPNLLGKLEANLADTLTLVHQHGALTGRDLVSMNPHLAINAASTRLKKLFDLHLVRRVEQIDENGRQFVYKPII